MTQTRKSSTKVRSSTVKHKQANRQSAKKTTSPLALHHHVKRAYHATPKFVHGMVVGGVFGLLVVGFLGGSFAHPSFTNALTAPTGGSGSSCDVKRVGTNDAGGVDSRFILNNNGTVTARFRVTGTNCKQAVTLVTWNAPNGTDGIPYSAQTQFAHTTGTFNTSDNNTVYTITTKLPNCFYQADLVTGSDISMYPATSFSSQGRLRGNLHGGTQPCTTPTPTPTPTPQPVEAASTTLPNTGPGEVLVVFALALAGGYLFHVTHNHRQRRAAHAGAHGGGHKAARHISRKR